MLPPTYQKLLNQFSVYSQLRGPAAIVFKSCNACSDSIAELFGACFCGGGGVSHNFRARYAAKWGVAHMCLCGTEYQGGGSHHFGKPPNLLEKVSRDMGYRSDNIANIARYGATKILKETD